MWETDQGLSLLQPSDLAFAEVAGWAAKDHSCPREQVGIASHYQLYLFALPPLDIHLLLGQYGGIRLDRVCDEINRTGELAGLLTKQSDTI